MKFEREDKEWIRFKVHPIQRRTVEVVQAEAPILEYRSVRSSTGKAEIRPVILTTAELMGIAWPVELTLARRDNMGFRMLFGREAFRGRFLVDAGKSYYGGRQKRRTRKKSSQKIKGSERRKL